MKKQAIFTNMNWCVKTQEKSKSFKSYQEKSLNISNSLIYFMLKNLDFKIAFTAANTHRFVKNCKDPKKNF